MKTRKKWNRRWGERGRNTSKIEIQLRKAETTWTEHKSKHASCTQTQINHKVKFISIFYDRKTWNYFRNASDYFWLLFIRTFLIRSLLWHFRCSFLLLLFLFLLSPFFVRCYFFFRSIYRWQNRNRFVFCLLSIEREFWLLFTLSIHTVQNAVIEQRSDKFASTQNGNFEWTYFRVTNCKYFYSALSSIWLASVRNNKWYFPIEIEIPFHRFEMQGAAAAEPRERSSEV